MLVSLMSRSSREMYRRESRRQEEQARRRAAFGIAPQRRGRDAWTATWASVRRMAGLGRS